MAPPVHNNQAAAVKFWIKCEKLIISLWFFLGIISATVAAIFLSKIYEVLLPRRLLPIIVVISSLTSVVFTIGNICRDHPVFHRRGLISGLVGNGMMSVIIVIHFIYQNYTTFDDIVLHIMISIFVLTLVLVVKPRNDFGLVQYFLQQPLLAATVYDEGIGVWHFIGVGILVVGTVLHIFDMHVYVPRIMPPSLESSQPPPSEETTPPLARVDPPPPPAHTSVVVETDEPSGDLPPSPRPHTSVVVETDEPAVDLPPPPPPRTSVVVETDEPSVDLPPPPPPRTSVSVETDEPKPYEGTPKPPDDVSPSRSSEDNHPVGRIEKSLIFKVKDRMKKEKELPLCREQDLIMDQLVEMTSKGCGCLLVIDDDYHLLGTFTDDDLRRTLKASGEGIFKLTVGEMCNRRPSTIKKEAMAVEAMEKMESPPSQFLPVIDENNILIGILTLQGLVSGL